MAPEADETAISRTPPPSPLVAPSLRMRPVLVVMNNDKFADWVILTERATSVGRDPKADVPLRDDTVSRVHFVVEYNNHEDPDDTPECYLADNGSRNGTFLNGIRISQRERLRNGDRIFIGNTSLSYFVRSEDEITSSRRLRQMATIDPLTGLPNRAFMMDEYGREFNRARRYLRPLTLMVMDLDDFSKINAAYDEKVGDFILQRTARLIASRIRTHDIAARSGGSAFALLMPETPIQGGLVMAERLRTTVGSHLFTYESYRIRLNMCVGVAELDAKRDRTLDDLMARAEASLDMAKQRGKNQVAAL